MAFLYQQHPKLQLRLLFFLCCISSPASADIVEAACKRAIIKGDDDSYSFCVRSLRAEPASRTADVRGLAAIAAGLAEASFADNLAAVHALLERERASGGWWTSGTPSFAALRACSAAYHSGGRSLGRASAGIKSERFGRALKDLLSASLAPAKCEDAFASLKAKKLKEMAERDEHASKLDFIAVAITALLTA